MATKAVYVLETSWAWDNVNTEYATITVEEPEVGFEEIFLNSKDERGKEVLLNRLKKIAEEQNGNPMGGNNLVALYRISWPGNSAKKWVRRKNMGNDVINIELFMVPVCSFDNKGEPVPYFERI